MTDDDVPTPAPQPGPLKPLHDPRELLKLWQRYEFFCARLTTEETCTTPSEETMAVTRAKCWAALHSFCFYLDKYK